MIRRRTDDSVYCLRVADRRGGGGEWPPVRGRVAPAATRVRGGDAASSWRTSTTGRTLEGTNEEIRGR
jgi:hypothetical protein